MQKHVIKRQIIELSVADPAQAHRLQVEVSRIYRQRIAPLIDRYCTRLSAPDRIHRIETLELDLGQIDPARLEQDLVEKVTAVLEQGLAQEIEAQERRAAGRGVSAQAQSQLELLAIFARTGRLPWWADASRPHLLADCGRYLLREAPGALRDLLQGLVREEKSLSRLAHHFDDDLLAGLVEVLVPALKGTFRRDFNRLIAALPGLERASRRQAMWRQILQTGGYAAGGEPGPAEFYRLVLGTAAAEAGLSLPALLVQVRRRLPPDSRLRSSLEAAPQPPADLRRALSGLIPRLPATVRREVLAALEEPSPEAMRQLLQTALAEGRLPAAAVKPRLAELAAAGVGLTLPEAASDQEPEAGRLDRRLRRLQAAGQSPANLWRALSGLAPRLPAAVRREMLAALEEPSPASIRRLLQTGLAEGRLPAAVVKPWLAELAAAGVGLTLPPSESEELSPDLSFSAGDEIYVDNAGLVILWPFLTNFFERLGLLADKRFQDAAARQRAVGLLQVLAAGQTDWPEYLLPLNKVLCGLDPDDLFDFGPPVTEPEAAECEGLLRAVIGQAPILKEMSPAGLRGTFLLRAGALRSRDGAWLLQVEQETYDLVLDRFPWGWEWVKLPWMEAPLRVEW